MTVTAQKIDKPVDFEWRRIELLALCLKATRENIEPSQSLLKELAFLQEQVMMLRKQAGWCGVDVHDLTPLDLDILSCVYAIEMRPGVALLFQELQNTNQHYPSLAFLFMLLVLSDVEFQRTKMILAPKGLLQKRGLVLTEGEGNLTIIKPHPNILNIITDEISDIHIPGTIKIEQPAKWDSLVLPSLQKQMLEEFLLWIGHRDTLVNDWGLQEPGGPIALFKGSSGTGKTFAASVIANTLGWSLYRVDLGMLISKYIGETEKNLNQLFDAAHAQQLVLQFDEVDALMGKRAEIRDARDRYANMEVSHLLSRIERHQGPCILTTNLSKELDSAFTRRFHIVIEFPRPEAPERQQLWEKLLPSSAPLSTDLDMPLLAESVNLTGGEIKNAIMHGAVLAASQKAPISMTHLSQGIVRVLQKQDWNISMNKLRGLKGFIIDQKEDLQ